MIYKIEGKIFEILEVQKGAKRNGNGEWVKQEFVIETSGDKPEKLAFFIWDELTNLKDGDIIAINFSIQARDWNGKWYTNLLAEDIKKLEDGPEKEAIVPTFNDEFDDEGDVAMGEFGEDLPF